MFFLNLISTKPLSEYEMFPYNNVLLKQERVAKLTEEQFLEFPYNNVLLKQERLAQLSEIQFVSIQQCSS